MKTLLYNFVKDEQGQDLIEYTLLLAFVCLASAALFISAGGSVSRYLERHELATGCCQHLRQLVSCVEGREPHVPPLDFKRESQRMNAGMLLRERPPASHERTRGHVRFRGKEKIQMKEKDPMLKAFLKDEQAQDLIEYTLLVAFVCLATAALFVSSGGSLSGIWTYGE